MLKFLCYNFLRNSKIYLRNLKIYWRNIKIILKIYFLFFCIEIIINWKCIIIDCNLSFLYDKLKKYFCIAEIKFWWFTISEIRLHNKSEEMSEAWNKTRKVIILLSYCHDIWVIENYQISKVNTALWPASINLSNFFQINYHESMNFQHFKSF